MEGISFFLAFGYGIISFVSACVLPLIPAYISYISGASFEELSENPSLKPKVILNSLLFIFGFSIVFISMGATATFLGNFLVRNQNLIRKLAGILIILFGLHMTSFLRIGILDFEKRVHLSKKPKGFLGSLLVGIAFAAGWTPCVGPILGSILTIASTQETIGLGVLLLSSYSLGLAIPFLATAIFMERFLENYKKISENFSKITFVGGMFMLLIGILML
ncbi:MAG: cytochrome c biogenesis CcdA family protein, partial [Candidatus Methanofastidiosia archaeon]